ncbi:MAG TPA: hypothetical protein VFB96_15655 [Pirellulaceae bacterium]|jgi:predicted transcriptional regulator|nr:hypothetical protein [Pirellulaceae bacterium]
MISIELDPAQQKQLDSLAASQGQDGATLARQILLDYIEFQNVPSDTDDQWAEASIALTPEIMESETWDITDNGS